MLIRWIAALLILASAAALEAQTDRILPGTQPLETKTDPAIDLVAGIDHFLTRETPVVMEKRVASWKPNVSSPEAYERWLAS